MSQFKKFSLALIRQSDQSIEGGGETANEFELRGDDTPLFRFVFDQVSESESSSTVITLGKTQSSDLAGCFGDFHLMGKVYDLLCGLLNEDQCFFGDLFFDEEGDAITLDFPACGGH